MHLTDQSGGERSRRAGRRWVRGAAALLAAWAVGLARTPRALAADDGERSGSDPAAPAPESTPRLTGSSFAGLDPEMPVEAGTLRFAAARSWTSYAGVAAGVLPGRLVPRLELAATLASFVVAPGGETRLFGPLVQVNWAVLAPTRSRHAGDVALDVWGMEAGLSSCSALTYDTRGWVALACAEFGVGSLFVEAESADGRRRSDQPGYGYAGLALDLQYNLSSWAHVGARVGGRMKTRMELDGPDGGRLFETASWGARATLGFGLHF